MSPAESAASGTVQGTMRLRDGLSRLRAGSVASLAVALGASLLVALPAGALDAGARMPDIGLPDLQGNPVDRAALLGKVVIVDFWASWCAPCKEEMPVLERLRAKHAAHGLVVIGVSVDEDAANVRAFLSKVKVGITIVHDRTHAVAERFAPPKMPSSYVIDRRGVVRYAHGGFRASDAEALAREVEKLLAESGLTKN